MRITKHKDVEIKDYYGSTKKNVVAMQFQSRFDMANFIEQTPNPNPKDYNDSTRPLSNEGWEGSESLEESLKLLRYGDATHGKKLKKIRDKMNLKSGTTDVSISYHSNLPERGPSLDIGRFVQDDPDMWMNHRMRVIEGRGHRLVRVFINVAVSWTVKADDIFRRMVNAATAIKELKQAGYSVGLYAGELLDMARTSPDGFKRIETSVKISEWGHEVTDNVLAFIAGNPSFLRRIIFACNERSGYMDSIGGGYGRVIYGDATPSFERFDICFNLSNDITPATQKIIDDLKK